MSTTVTAKPKRSLGQMFKHALPRRTRRLILYASLTAMLREQGELDARLLAQLNQVMGLSEGTEALKLPVFLQEAIWESPAGIDLPTGAYLGSSKSMDLETFVRQFIERVPSWLRYDRREVVEAELRRFFTHTKTLLDRRNGLRMA